MVNGDKDNSRNGSSRPSKGMFVRCNDRDYLAYRDAEGKWRDFYTGELLPGTVTTYGSTSEED